LSIEGTKTTTEEIYRMDNRQKKKKTMEEGGGT